MVKLKSKSGGSYGVLQVTPEIMEASKKTPSSFIPIKDVLEMYSSTGRQVEYVPWAEWKRRIMLSHLVTIQGKLYMTDFRMDDLQKFHKVYGYEDIARSINLGARDMKASNAALVPIEPKEFVADNVL